MQRQVDAAILSVTASVAGNAVTFVQQLQFCTAAVIMSPDPASFECIRASKGPVYTTAIITYGIVSIFLPFVLDGMLTIFATAATRFRLLASQLGSRSQLGPCSVDHQRTARLRSSRTRSDEHRLHSQCCRSSFRYVLQ